VITSYLELIDVTGLRPAAPPAVPVEIARASDPDVNRALYEEVGRDWSWTDRLPWTREEWAAWSQRVETWVATAAGERAGYYELDPQGADVEIASFGLLPAFHRRGIGGHLLTHAIRRAFALPGARRVWVHTCTLDGPHALANYEARGMRGYKVERS
jgi:ribosomal protein S18 acetylase RimI-like enzyme